MVNPLQFLGELSTAMQSRLSLILWVAMLALMAIGFGFQTPASKFRQIDARISTGDSVVTARLRVHDVQLDGLANGQASQQELIEGLIRLSCYKENTHLIELAGLPCRRLQVGQQSMAQQNTNRSP